MIARKKMVRRARVRAFTLLEVLMVVVIIGLLAAFVVPNFFGVGEQAKVDLTRATIDSGFNGALTAFRANVGRYPTGDEGLKVLNQRPEDEEAAKKWAGPYIEDLNKLRDAWGREFRFASPGEYNREGYDLSSAGKDGEFGTDDDIVNWKSE